MTSYDYKEGKKRVEEILNNRTGSIRKEKVPKDNAFSFENDKSYYKGLMKIKNRATATKYKFKGIPYFSNYNGHLVSQFRMSSGESMLISLIDFINNLIVKAKSKPQDRFLFLIDEVELALHPGAIDRLIIFLEGL